MLDGYGRNSNPKLITADASPTESVKSGTVIVSISRVQNGQGSMGGVLGTIESGPGPASIMYTGQIQLGSKFWTVQHFLGRCIPTYHALDCPAETIMPHDASRAADNVSVSGGRMCAY